MEGSYDRLRTWYLARLRKFAHDSEAARALTPGSLIVADRAIVERIIAQKAAEISAKPDKKGERFDPLFLLFGLGIFSPVAIQILFVLIPTFASQSRTTDSGSAGLQLFALIFSSICCGVTILAFKRCVAEPMRKCRAIVKELTDTGLLRDGSEETASANLETTLRTLSAALGEAKEKERAIADYSLNVILSLDQQGQILSIGPACLREWGYLPEELVNRNIKNILPEQQRDGFDHALKQARTMRKSIQVENRIRSKNSMLLDMLWTTEWSESDGALFCIAENVTPQRTLERVKQEFVSMISHDLKSPLNSLELVLAMLQKGVCGELSTEAQFDWYLKQERRTFGQTDQSVTRFRQNRSR